MSAYLISAVGTPLNDAEDLHLAGLEALLAAQFEAGIDGVLIAGSMGCLQLLRHDTYTKLIEHSVRLFRGKGELLVGVGDAGFARTVQRIEYVNQFTVDGVVAITPYLFRYNDAELLDYYRGLAEAANAPLFLYDLPSLTGVKLDHDLVVELSKHNNIAGIKCSGDIRDALELIDRVDPSFRVIVAQAERLAQLCQQGVVNHLDGVYSLVPEWTRDIAVAAAAGDGTAAEAAQQRLTGILELLHEYGVFPTYSELMNLRGIPGQFAPRPFRELDEVQCGSLRSRGLAEELRHIGANDFRVNQVPAAPSSANSNDGRAPTQLQEELRAP